jgi:hypothetical protein
MLSLLFCLYQNNRSAANPRQLPLCFGFDSQVRVAGLGSLLPFANVSAIPHELCAERNVTRTGVFISGRNNRWAAQDKPSIAQILTAFWREQGATFKYPNIAMWARMVIDGDYYSDSNREHNKDEAFHFSIRPRAPYFFGG